MIDFYCEDCHQSFRTQNLLNKHKNHGKIFESIRVIEAKKNLSLFCLAYKFDKKSYVYNLPPPIMDLIIKFLIVSLKSYPHASIALGLSNCEQRKIKDKEQFCLIL